MRVIRNIVFLSAVSAAALSLTACETMKKAGDAITSIDVPFYGDDDVEAQEGLVMAQAQGCPQIAVVEDLKNLTQFETPSAPKPEEKISSVAITGLDTKCSVTKNTVAVDIAIRFDGELGPQAREWNAPSRSFAYPYFMAVTTPTGEILSKEVFAATIRYDEGDIAITQQEKTRQVIPLRDDAKPGQYEILIGFQLTEDELSYARTLASPAVAEATTEAHDLAPTAKATPVYPEVQAAPAEKVVSTPVKETKTEIVAETKTEAAPLPTVSAPEPEAVPTTADDSMKPAATSAEKVEEASKPVTETVTPAAQPAEETASTPAPVSPAPVAPAIDNPYAPPPTQVIRIKADGSIEKK